MRYKSIKAQVWIKILKASASHDCAKRVNELTAWNGDMIVNKS